MVRIEWDQTSEDLLIQGLKKAVAEARTGDNNFQPAVYQTISDTLQTHGYEIDQKKVKSRWTRFKTARNTVARLRGMSGFGWDEGKKVVVATEAVWRKVLYDEKGQQVKKFKEFNQWRKKAFPLFNEVTELMGGNQAVGNNAFSSQNGTAAAPPALPAAPAATSAPDLPPPTSMAPDSALTIPSQDTQDIGPLSDGAIRSRDVSPTPDSPRMGAALPLLGTSTPSSASRSKRALSPPPPPSTPVSSKRPKAANTQSQLSLLCSSVGKLVDSLTGEPQTPSLGSEFSPIRKKAWEKVNEKEDLSPYSLSRARRVFRSQDCVKEYLSFSDDQAAARAFWLQDEMDITASGSRSI